MEAVSTTPHTQISDWLVQYLQRSVNSTLIEIQPDSYFERIGLDSASVLDMICDLEDHFGIELSHSLAYEFPTINELAHYIAGQMRTPATTNM